MDLNTVTEFAPAATAAWRAGDAWLGGGTWLFSQPQPRVQRLLDLHAFGWTPLTETDDGLRIAATCTLAELARWRPKRPAYTPGASLGRRCCDALLGSFKVQNVATVGGNICLSLPAGPMTSLAASLDGTAALAGPDGGGRRVPVGAAGHRRRAERARPRRAPHAHRPARLCAGRAFGVPPALALPRGPVRGPGHRAPRRRRRVRRHHHRGDPPPGPAPLPRAARRRHGRWPRSTAPTPSTATTCTAADRGARP